MKKSLEAQIYIQCPIIFRDRKQAPERNLMYFGFDHDDGWFQIVHDACIEIERIAARLKRDGLEQEYLPLISQIKEKYGALNIYVHNLNDEIEIIIDRAEELSEKTCMSCGKLGQLSTQGWHKTLCPECQAVQ